MKDFTKQQKPSCEQYDDLIENSNQANKLAYLNFDMTMYSEWSSNTIRIFTFKIKAILMP